MFEISRLQDNITEFRLILRDIEVDELLNIGDKHNIRIDIVDYPQFFRFIETYFDLSNFNDILDDIFSKIAEYFSFKKEMEVILRLEDGLDRKIVVEILFEEDIEFISDIHTYLIEEYDYRMGRYFKVKMLEWTLEII